MIKKEYQYPVRVMLAEGGIEQPEKWFVPQSLQVGIAAPPPYCVHILGKASVVLDFGKEMRATLRILCHYVTKDGQRAWAPVRVRFGESVSECCAELGERGAGNDHALRDFRILVGGNSDECWGNSGFRFVRLDFLEDGMDIYIKSVLAVGEILDLPVRYTYEGQDPLIRNIYDTARRTVDLCAAGEYVWDGVKRDRLVWVGDMHPEMLALCTLYGRLPAMERSLLFLRDTTPQGDWINCIATYSAWWVIVLADYYNMTGCADFVAPLLSYAEGIVRQFLGFVGADGSLHFDGQVVLVDWPTRGQPDEMAGVRAILLFMAKRAAALFAKMAYPAGSAVELISRLSQQPITVTHSMQVAALKYMANGELPREDVELLRRTGAEGMSTFMSYYILTAYARYFGKEAALSLMKTYYGAMLSRGATTFFEDFSMGWLDGSGRIDEFPAEGERDLHGDFGAFCYVGFRHSLCHGWSAGVIRFLADMGC